ncbi:MAG: choice-of-anchor J domain-containing protein [Moheibacter sp.]
MKKILFSLIILTGLLTVNAQTVVWSDDFEDEDISDWTNLDEDGDSYTWNTVVLDTWSAALSSDSYINGGTGPVTPDNWVISPAIDLSGASGTTLKFKVKAQDPDWADENYSVYVATSSDLVALEANLLLNELVTDNGVGGVYYDKEIDLSAFDGEAEVYIAFRHHDVTDMFSIQIDDVSVEVDVMGLSDLNTSFSSVYPNPVVDDFNIQLSEKFNQNASISVTNLAGQIVKTFEVANSYSITELPKGVYILKITDGKNTETRKIIKK